MTAQCHHNPRAFRYSILKEKFLQNEVYQTTLCCSKTMTNPAYQPSSTTCTPASELPERSAPQLPPCRLLQAQPLNPARASLVPCKQVCQTRRPYRSFWMLDAIPDRRYIPSTMPCFSMNSVQLLRTWGTKEQVVLVS